MSEDAPIRSYRDLRVWGHGMALARTVYIATRAWPREEQFGLTSQARRAATSVPANIAEGYGRQTRASYAHFLRVAQGSLKELETHLLLAVEVEVCSADSVADALDQAEVLGRMLRGLIGKLAADK